MTTQTNTASFWHAFEKESELMRSSLLATLLMAFFAPLCKLTFKLKFPFNSMWLLSVILIDSK